MPDTNRNNVLCMGWVGQGDFGDEAMAFVLRKFLKQNGLENLTYYHLGKYPCYQGKDDLPFSSLYSFDTPGWKKRLFDHLYLKKFAGSITGGGTVLHSYHSIAWRLEVVRRIKAAHPEAFTASVGVSFGTLEDDEVKKACRKFLQASDLIVVRDGYSAKIAESIAGPHNLFSSLDTSLLLPEVAPEEWGMAVSRQKEDNLVGLMFVQKKGTGEKNHFDEYLKVVDHLIDKGKRVLLLTLYVGDAYSDKELNLELKRRAKRPDLVQIHDFDGDIFETVRQLQRCSRIVSMRLHGIIFAYLMGIPFVSLGYQRKNRDFCDSVRYPKELAVDYYAQTDLTDTLRAIDNLCEKDPAVFKDALPLDQAASLVRSNLERLTGLLHAKNI
ncbi:polysaccharide pyruvyl transferase family protein [Candidatus Uhrbacteria bacterium]|nr:polysaccharide pyruvyl transferase family protein [Candidatus Uhrbacteria bacterium]